MANTHTDIAKEIYIQSGDLVAFTIYAFGISKPDREDEPIFNEVMDAISNNRA